MIPLSVCHFSRNKRRYAVWVLACFCASGLMPAAYGQSDAQQTPQVAAPAAPTAAATQPAPAQPQTYDHTLQDGTPVKLQLSKRLSSADAKAGQEVLFEVVDDIDVDGITVLHRGASVIGAVTKAQAKKRMGRAGKLNFSIAYVRLADNERAALRAVNDSRGDSNVAVMTAFMISMPIVAAPFFLLMKGGDTSIPQGTEITAFIDGDIHLDMAKFGAAPVRRLTPEHPPEPTR